MTYADFVGSRAARRRYWARSARGWPVMRDARANAGHRAIALLLRRGLLGGVITQNVDGLHARAGAPEALELHGNLSRIVCLTCGELSGRENLQRRLSVRAQAMTQHRAHDASGAATRSEGEPARPDGDADVPDEHIVPLQVPECEGCGGILKPDVVFFGESVPTARVRAATAMVDDAPALLVVGSSLTVFSGRRLAVRTAKQGKPVLLVNRGPTRADGTAALKINEGASQVLSALVALLTTAGASPRTGRTTREAAADLV
jgi:NAD-dependent SIR2 family protein deacetylase